MTVFPRWTQTTQRSPEMIMSLHNLCLIIAVVLLFIAAFWTYWESAPRFGPGWAGLFFYALKDIFAG